MIILLILFSPCVLKSIYKNKKCIGYGLGLCCSIVVSIVNFLLVISLFASTAIYDKEFFDSIIDNQNAMNNNFNFEKMLSLPYKVKIMYSILYGFFNINVFFMNFKFIKRLANQQRIYNVIFTFISGYLLLNVITYSSFIYFSFDPEIINIDMIIKYNLNKENILLAIEIILTLQIFGYIGTAIMLFLHQKRKNSAIIWLCIVSYFFPNIFFIVGLFIKIIELIILPLLIFNLISLLLGTIFYCKYADSKQEDGDVRLLINPPNAILPPY